MENIIELTWQMWVKCFWATFVTISIVKLIVFPWGQNLWKWFKGKPLKDFLVGFGITYFVLMLGVDLVPLAEWLGIDMGKVGDILSRLSEHPIKMTIVTAIVTQIFILRWRNKKTPNGQIYSVGGQNPKDDDEKGNA